MHTAKTEKSVALKKWSLQMGHNFFLLHTQTRPDKKRKKNPALYKSGFKHTTLIKVKKGFLPE